MDLDKILGKINNFKLEEGSINKLAVAAKDVEDLKEKLKDEGYADFVVYDSVELFNINQCL